MSFPPFTGHGPCPKCASALYVTRYREATERFDEHLHRFCETCEYSTVEALATPEQRRLTPDRFVLATGIEQVNKLGNEGYTVAAAWGMGVQVGAIMELPE